MELMKKVQQLILGLLILLAFSCGKDDDGATSVTPAPTVPNNPANPVIQSCQLTGFNEDNRYGENLTFDSNGRVIKISQLSTGYSYTVHADLFYNQAGQLTERKSYRNNVLEERQEYTYAGNGLVATMKIFYTNRQSSPPQMYLARAISFFYNSNIWLIKEISASYVPGDSNVIHSTYTYLNPKTVRFERQRITGAQATTEHIYEYTLDAMKNPRNQYGLRLTGPFFENNLLTANTIFDINNHPLAQSTYSYTYNAAGYPTVEKRTNIYGATTRVTTTNYTYNCQ